MGAFRLKITIQIAKFIEKLKKPVNRAKHENMGPNSGTTDGSLRRHVRKTTTLMYC